MSARTSAPNSFARRHCAAAGTATTSIVRRIRSLRMKSLATRLYLTAPKQLCRQPVGAHSVRPHGGRTSCAPTAARLRAAMPLRTCVFPCAGFGTRFFPATKVIPKEMLPLVEVSEGETSRYGIVAGELVGDRLFKVRDMVEKPKTHPPSRYATIGRYILPPEIFPILQSTGRGAGGEIQLTDALRGLVREGGGFYGYVFEGTRYDAGEKLGYLKATVDFALKNDALGEDFAEYLRGAMEKHGEEDRHPRPAGFGSSRA